MQNEKNEILENEQENPLQSGVFTPQPYQPKPLFDLTKGDTAFAICAVISSIFTSIFGFFGGFAFGYLLSIVFMVTLFGVYFSKCGKAHILPIICGILSLMISAVFICTTNGSVRFFGAVISLLLTLVCFDGLMNGSSRGNRQTIRIFFSAAFSIMDNIDITLKSLFSNGNGGKRTIVKVLIGLLCAMPVLIIVVPLLISSDYAFHGMMSEVFNNAFSIFLKLIFGVFLSLFIISYGFSLKTGRVSKLKEGNFSGIENVYIISFLSAIGVCYLLYLFSQLAYFFSAFKGFLPDGEITYAQYARKGFFEMCVISVINLVIVFSALLMAKKENGKVCHSIKAIATFIAVFTLIIITTAISKMILYINTYGMTVLRLTTSAFMIFLGVVFISVILRIYITKINVVKTALITAGCIVLVLGVANVNAVCANYNYNSYQTKKLDPIDIAALYDLGDEGIPYIIKLSYSEDNDIAYEAKRYLAQAYLYDYFDDMEYYESFTVDDLVQKRKNKCIDHFSIPKARAYDELYKFIEDNPWFSPMCRFYFETY